MLRMHLGTLICKNHSVPPPPPPPPKPDQVSSTITHPLQAPTGHPSPPLYRPHFLQALTGHPTPLQAPPSAGPHCMGTPPLYRPHPLQALTGHPTPLQAPGPHWAPHPSTGPTLCRPSLHGHPTPLQAPPSAGPHWAPHPSTGPRPPLGTQPSRAENNRRPSDKFRTKLLFDQSNLLFVRA